MSTHSKADAAFKKEQKVVEATEAWRDYEANKAAADANMLRLRALRLAREAVPPATEKKARKKSA